MAHHQEQRPMALKAVIETLEGVDDAVKPFYTEADGKFVLAVDGVDDHPEVANLRNAYTRTKADKDAAKTLADSLKAQITDLQKGAPDTAATQAKLAQMEEQLQAAQAEAGEWRGKYTGVTRDQALATELQKAGITNPTFLKAAQTMLSGQVKLGDDGSAYVETNMGPKVLPDFVKVWAAGEGKDFVSPPAGGGARGNEGRNAGTGKVMSRGDFDALGADQKAAFIREGGKLVA
jgi:uncharacterized membrane protein YdfJ with MMPL/SSD domain